jgi:septation ring formation regulator EzrA
MTAINTIEDLVRIMDERPEWVEAMRVRLLTREVLELPQTIAKLAETVEKFIDSTNKRLDSIAARLDQHDARFDAVDARFDQVDARFEAVDARFDQVDARFEAVDARFDQVDARFEAVDARFETVNGSIQKLRNDIAPLKAAHARNAAIDDAIAIASDLGLRRTKNLTRDEVWELTESVDTSGIPTNELRSFRRADLIVEATDKNDEVCYVAVEISFTANGRDTIRAIRNAEFLNRFTGRRSYAAVAGLSQDNRVNEVFESGEVFWYQLDPDHLEVE